MGSVNKGIRYKADKGEVLADKRDLDVMVNAVREGTRLNPDYESRITKEQLRKLLPKGSSRALNDNVMDIIYSMEDDTGVEQEVMEERFLSNINLMKDLGISMPEYVNAVKYCVLKQNMSNRKAWEIVFPDRIERLERLTKERAKEGREASVNIDSHVSNFNGTDAVVAISTQMAVAFDVLYAPARHMALMRLIEMGQGKCAPSATGEVMTVTPHVQFLANKEVVDVLKPPEAAKLEIDVNVNKGGIIDEYEKAIAMMAKAKMEQIESGGNMLEAINAPVRAVDTDNDIIDMETEEFEGSLGCIGNDL